MNFMPSLLNKDLALFLQNKVNVLIVYHAIAKPCPTYQSGTNLLRDIGKFLSTKEKKYKVKYILVLISEIKFHKITLMFCCY